MSASSDIPFKLLSWILENTGSAKPDKGPFVLVLRAYLRSTPETITAQLRDNVSGPLTVRG